MEPKFQSSFIPKGPVTSGIADISGRRSSPKSLLAFLGTVIFTGSVLLAGAVFGYKLYLNYALTNLAGELEAGRASLEPEIVEELLDLNGRLNSTKELINNHSILSPLFKFLEASTLKSVRFTSMSYSTTKDGIKLSMDGEAKSYSSLALEADAITKNKYFKSPVFSDLTLDNSGNVSFSFEATLDPVMLSYPRFVETLSLPPVSTIATTTTATTTGRTATSTGTTTPR